MNVNRIQTKLLKSMLEGHGVSYGKLDNDKIYLSSDGVVAYVFNAKELMIDLSKCKLFDVANIWNESGYQILKMGQNLKISKNGKTIMRELIGDFGSVYVDHKRFADFDLPEIYGKSAEDAVLIKEYGKTVGLIMPIRYDEG